MMKKDRERERESQTETHIEQIPDVCCWLAWRHSWLQLGSHGFREVCIIHFVILQGTSC